MLVFAMVAHEYAHAVDRAPAGRRHGLHARPGHPQSVPHIDPWMSLLLPALLWFGSGGQFTFGGAKPVPVNSRKFRNYRRGDIIVSAAGVATNLVLAVVCAVLFVLLGLIARRRARRRAGARHGAADDGATGSGSTWCSASST